MPYQAEISRSNPGVIGFLIDQSGSMEYMMRGTSMKKSRICADYIDSFLDRLITRNLDGDIVKNRFEVFALGYGQDENGNPVYSVLSGYQMGQPPISLEKLDSFRQIREVDKKYKEPEPDGAGGTIDGIKIMKEKIPFWITERHFGLTPKIGRAHV